MNSNPPGALRLEEGDEAGGLDGKAWFIRWS